PEPVAVPGPIPAPAPAPAPAPVPVVVVEQPVVEDCRRNGQAESSRRPCQPPRWGHTDQGNPRPD
ncbi:MAG: hypothetical protein ACRD0N_11880, partial [Acidimicrobiales bacterium]